MASLSARLLPTRSSRAHRRRAASAASVDMLRRGLAIALASMLPGLVQTDLAQAGDFGRPSPSLLDGLIPKQFFKGPVFPQSTSPITDLEEELRDRSYALIHPNEPRGNWNLYIAGFQV